MCPSLQHVTVLRTRLLELESIIDKLPLEAASAPESVLRAAAGRILEITKSLTTVGHPKVQVAVITRRSDGYHLAQVEGATPAQINGAPVAPYAMLLREHDIIEIAGIKLEFFFGA